MLNGIESPACFTRWALRLSNLVQGPRRRTRLAPQALSLLCQGLLLAQLTPSAHVALRRWQAVHIGSIVPLRVARHLELLPGARGHRALLLSNLESPPGVHYHRELLLSNLELLPGVHRHRVLLLSNLEMPLGPRLPGAPLLCRLLVSPQQSQSVSWA